MILTVALAVVAAVTIPERQMIPVERLNAELLAGRTATETLEKWCADRRLAEVPRVHAEVDRAPAPVPSASVRNRLKVAKNEPLGFRRVRLMCDRHILSEATNWYVPARLTPEMNAALANSDAPFGRVILPLSPRRQNLSARILADSDAAGSRTILRHRALVLDDQGRPLAEVTENYQRVLVTPDQEAAILRR